MSDQLVIKEELSDIFDNEILIKVEVPEVDIKVEEQDLTGDCCIKYEPSLDLNVDFIGDGTKTEIDDTIFHNEKVLTMTKRFKSTELLTCYNCNFKALRGTLIKHMKIHDMTQENNSITRNSINDLKTYLMMQSNVSVKCRVCNYKTMNYSALKAHMNSHIGEKIFKCEICKYNTKYKSTLKVHLMRHNNETPFVCPYCDYKTVKHSDLKRHTIIHTGDKPFKCEICDYKTNRSYRLKVHKMRIHSYERPYKCSVCDYKATTASDFKRHMCTHKEEKPYSCSQCNYVTSRLYDLKMHMNKHSGIYLHECNQCGHKTNYLSSFKKHMKTHSKNLFK